MNIENRTLFTNIVNYEDDITELLCNLMQLPNLREIFVETIINLGKIEMNSRFLDCTTQVETDETGAFSRPDFQLNFEQGIIVIENKAFVLTPLTDNQPRSYLQFVEATNIKNRSLLFIVPRNYVHIPEIRNRAEAYFSENKASRTHFEIISWEDFVENVEAKCAKLSSGEAYLLASFTQICKNVIYGAAPVALDDKEFEMINTPENISALGKIMEILGKSERIVKELGENKLNLSKEMRPDQKYMIYLAKNFDNNFVLWYGIDFDAWLKFKSPIVIGVTKNKWFQKIYDEIFRKKLKGWEKRGDDLILPIPAEIIVSKMAEQTVSEYINQQFDQLNDLL